MLAVSWAVEKLQYYLIHKKFVIVTDHKALEGIHKEKEFGTMKMQIWIERLSIFDFKNIYREGSKLLQADKLSRTVFANSFVKYSPKNDLEDRIFQLHEKYGHRKTLWNIIKKENIEINFEKLKEIINKSKICLMKDKKLLKFKICKYLKTR
ncbi:Retrovirus-related Pol polyprotein from transposon [Dictyocoela muelleri]|nr:Retrovirus-related Pol polyprotein from transposon [Dictyocoela muelleri]